MATPLHARTPAKGRTHAAAFKAQAVRQPTPGLLVPSAQGRQYTATRFRDLLAQPGAAPSRSRRGTCDDDAQAESLWRRLTTALLDGGSFRGPHDARFGRAHYIGCHHDERRHSAPGDHSPHCCATRF